MSSIVATSVSRDTNKIQVSLNSKQYYQDDGIKSENTKTG